MTGRKKLTFVVGGVAAGALLVGLGSAGAIAASRMLSPSDESKAVIDDAAAQLGVEPAELSAALKQALKNRTDTAVKAGILTEERAKELKERIDSDEFPLLFGAGGPWGRGFRHDGHGETLGTAASYLGMTEAELREALETKTLADIAKEKGKSVSGLVNALVAAQEKRIDKAVADGRITQAQGAELKSRLHEHVEALVNRELRRHGDGPPFGFRWGWGPPRGPPPLFGGPRA